LLSVARPRSRVFHLPAVSDTKYALRNWLQAKRFVFWGGVLTRRVCRARVMTVTQFKKAFGGHRGLLPHVADGLADISLCLSLVRRRAAVGDLVLVMAVAAPRHPRPYVAAARAAEAVGDSVVVAALRVSAVCSLGDYCRRYGSRAWRGTEDNDPTGYKSRKAT